MRVAILGLTVTSTWGNGHATNYRGLMRALEQRGHEVLFLERDVPWYAAARDLPDPPWGSTALYSSLEQLERRHAEAVSAADLAIVGSYVPDGVAVGDWVLRTASGLTAFYDIDTPVTLAKLARGDEEYLAARQVPGYDPYLSFTGGPTLGRIERELGSPRAVAFHCLVDPGAYPALPRESRWDLGYLGTYSPDRQPALERLLIDSARRRPDLSFVVAGPGYPEEIRWPANVQRIEHLPAAQHPPFYASQRLTLNITRADMLAAGFSPSVRLFEAAACATPVISDRWPGLESFFEPGRELLCAESAGEVLAALEVQDERLREIGHAARARVLAEHTGEHRVEELERLLAAQAVAR